MCPQIICAALDLLYHNNCCISDPDITKGDGVYSRYFSALSEGMHTFEIVVMDNGNTAYSWQENAAMEKCKFTCVKI